ncbi:MAG: nucleotidyltransferase [Candidatus Lokiarchaeota archaeon]|nr:nucleotidyltransferase [Candidatus Lokiarchaeota archaeon]
MPREKVNYRAEEIEVKYTEEQWNLFQRKRRHAKKVCKALHEHGIPILIYGSTARGDVNENSDLDILINANIPPFRVELSLIQANLQIIGREIVQATPSDVIKGHLYLSNDTCMTIFLTRGKDLNYEFYKFSGSIDYKDLMKSKRVPGIDKSLTLVIPTEKGHKKMNLLGNEKYAVKILGISPKIIKVRKRVLLKRDKVGRTGVFLHEMLQANESFGEVLKRISDRNSLVKRKIRQ